MINLTTQADEKELRGAQIRNKHVKWSESIAMPRTMKTSKVGKVGCRIVRENDRQESNSHRAFKWTKFWRRVLWFHSDRKVHAVRPESLKYDDSHRKVHAVRPESVSYDDSHGKGHAVRPETVSHDDSQRYAMQFKKHKAQTQTYSSERMPKTASPGPRQTATVLLTSSLVTKRTLPSTLMPTAVTLNAKQDTNVPLWKRRRVSAPTSLHIRKS